MRAAFLCLFLSGCCAFSGPTWRGPVSDHLDVPTLRRIEKTFPRARIYAGLGNAEFLRGQRLHHVYDLDWWQSVRYGRAEIVGVPAQHFSGRGLCDRNGTLFLGYVLRG